MKSPLTLLHRVGAGTSTEPAAQKSSVTAGIRQQLAGIAHLGRRSTTDNRANRVELPARSPVQSNSSAHSGSSAPPGGGAQFEGVSYFPQPEPGGAPVTLPHLEPVEPAPSDAASAQLGSSGSSTASRRSAVAGAVIDPDTGLLRKDHLRQFAGALANALPAPPPDAPAKAVQLYGRLGQTLRAIGAIAADDTRLPPDQLGLKVRDQFARAARQARELSGALAPAISLPGRPAEHRAAAVQYLGVAAMFNELKRAHLSAAAGDVMDSYVDKEMAQLDRAAEGLLASRPGAYVSTRKAGEIGANYLGGQGFIGGSYERTILNDDPAGGAPEVEADPGPGNVHTAGQRKGKTDVDFWTSYGAYVKGGYGWDVKGWGLSLMGKLGVTRGGTTFEQSTLKDLMRLVTNMDANRSPARSAGPRARRFETGRQHLQEKLGRALGRNYMPAPGLPTYLGDGKMEKGFMSARLHLAAGMLDAQAGDTRFTDLVTAAYPEFGQLLRERLDNHQQMPRPRGPVPLSAAYRDLEKWFAFEQDAFNVNFRAGDGTDGDSPIWEAAGHFDGGATIDRMQFNFATEAPPHRLLSVDYAKDFQSALGLMRDVDAQPPDKSAQFHLYRQVRDSLAGTPPPSLRLDPAQRKHYGDHVPASLRAAVAQPDAAKLDRTTQALGTLSHTYASFVTDADLMMSKPDRTMVKAQREALEHRRDQAFERINQQVWGGAYPGGKDKALKDPKQFVSRSYAGLSTALGFAGAHLSVLKHEMGRDPALHTDENRQAIRQADEAYKSARDMLDGIFLPMKAYDAISKGPFNDRATWRRWRAIPNMSASGGASSSVLNAVLGHWHKSTGVVSVANEAGQLMLKAEFQFQHADKQVNPARLGNFLQMTFTAQGGAPLTGIAINKAITAAVEKFNAGAKNPDEKMDASEVMRQMQGLVLDQADGTSLQIKLHQSPGVRALEADQQFLRLIRTKNSGLNVSASIPVPTPAGVVMIKPSVGYTDSAGGIQLEIIGTDLDYQILRYPQIGELLERARQEGGPALRKQLDAHPDIKNAYFARDDTILKTLQRYVDYRQAEADGKLGGKHLVNAFERYYHTEPFKRAAEVANHVKHYAPGASAGGADPFAPHARSLAEGFDVREMPDLDEARRALAATRSVDERADFFCGPKGQALLSAYQQVMESVCGIKSAAMFHTGDEDHGFKAELRDPKMRATARRQLESDDTARRALHGEKPKAGLLSSMSPERSSARQLSLAELQMLSGNRTLRPEARAAIGAELSRRASMLQRPLAPPEQPRLGRQPLDTGGSLSAQGIFDTSDPSAPKQAPALGQKAPSGLGVPKGLAPGGHTPLLSPRFDANGATQAVRVLGQLPGWGADTGRAGGAPAAVQGFATAASVQPSDPLQRLRADMATQDHRDHLARNMAGTRAWLDGHGIAAAPNRGGNGVDCLIISLLQHATRQYGSEHAQLASRYRAELKKAFPQVGNDMLLPDDHAFQWLVNRLNRDFGRSLQVQVYTPGPEGHPVMLPQIGQGSEPVAVLQGPAHFEALTMKARAAA